MNIDRNVLTTTQVQLGLITAIALAVRLAQLHSATPWYDDFYHLLAARSLLLDGSLSIGAGEYTRASLFTRLVAMSTAVFGDSLAAGRVPAVLAGTLWVTAVFAWTRHVAGSGAAWGAGLLLAFDPGAIYLSQWVRFYTLHGLLVFIGAISVYRLFSRPVSPGRAALIAVPGLGAFALGFALQPSTLIAVAAAAIWAGVVSVPRLYRSLTRNAKLWWLVGGGAAIALALGVWVIASGTAAEFWRTYTTPFPWQRGSTIDYRWYAWWLSNRYPTLWSLLPLAIVAGVARFPRPTLFALWMFLVAFVAVSLAAVQAERYLYFGLPFFFVVWGLALASLVPALRAVGERALGAVKHLGLPQRVRGPAIVAFTAVTVAFVISQNDASRMAFRMIFPGPGDRPYARADWEAVLPQLRPHVDSADVIVSSNLLKPMYFFDRGDVHLSWTEAFQSGSANGRPVEFAINPKTGRPAISAPESLARVMACFPSGLVLTQRYHLNRPHLLPKGTTEFLVGHTTQVPLPQESQVLAYRWRHDVSLDAPGCPPWQSETPAPRPPSDELETPVY